jgi:RimJ/RimL family protein N-acetyltransferase
MTLDIRPLMAASELAAIVPQKRQAAAMLTSGAHDRDFDAVLAAGPGFIGYDEQGPLGAIGFAIRWRGHAAVWALIAERGLHNPVNGMLVTAMAHRMLDDAGYERIECHVEEGWERAHRWVRTLGFESEGLMRKFRDGRDYRLYARIK